MKSLKSCIEKLSTSDCLWCWESVDVFDEWVRWTRDYRGNLVKAKFGASSVPTKVKDLHTLYNCNWVWQEDYRFSFGQVVGCEDDRHRVNPTVERFAAAVREAELSRIRSKIDRELYHAEVQLDEHLRRLRDRERDRRRLHSDAQAARAFGTLLGLGLRAAFPPKR